MHEPQTTMTAKEYLSQAHLIDMRINNKLEQAASLRALATKATSTLSDMPKSSTPALQSMENHIIKMVDIEKEVNVEIDTLIEIKRELMAAINQMCLPEHRAVLEMRYLCFKTWKQISEAMNCDERWVYRLHTQALKQFEIDNGNLRAIG